MKEPEDCVSRPFTLLTRPIGGGSLSSGGCTVRSSNVLGPCYHGWSKVKNAGRPGTRASFLYSHVIYEARSLQVPFTKPAVAGKQLRRQQKREFGGSAIVACWVPKLKLGIFCACDTTVLLRLVVQEQQCHVSVTVRLITIFFCGKLRLDLCLVSRVCVSLVVSDVSIGHPSYVLVCCCGPPLFGTSPRADLPGRNSEKRKRSSPSIVGSRPGYHFSKQKIKNPLSKWKQQ